MIYLSQLKLDPRSNRVQSEMRNPYEMHRTLARAFDSTPEAQQAARCLFRVESGASSMESGVLVLVQSKTSPDWERLRAETGGHFPYLRAASVKELSIRLVPGQEIAFRLRANPTIAHDGVRTGLYGDEERLKWFARKAQLSGFVPINVCVTDEPPVSAPGKGESKPAAFSAARFDGVLRVTDPDKLTAALENGIGAAKGFGFGLLSLAKA